jgi:CTP synthase (UTP-ammonia lyase)
VIEYARTVLGLTEADHAETNPSATFALITPLVCSLSGGAQGDIFFRPGSRIAAIYGRPSATEEFNCNYGMSPDHQSLLASGDLHVSGVDSENEVRVVELEGHPFFIATLYQPERSAFKGVVHPLLRAFLQATMAASSAS